MTDILVAALRFVRCGWSCVGVCMSVGMDRDQRRTPPSTSHRAGCMTHTEGIDAVRLTSVSCSRAAMTSCRSKRHCAYSTSIPRVQPRRFSCFADLLLPHVMRTVLPPMDNLHGLDSSRHIFASVTSACCTAHSSQTLMLKFCGAAGSMSFTHNVGEVSRTCCTAHGAVVMLIPLHAACF